MAKIIVIDNDPHTLSLFKSLLEKKDHQVTCCQDSVLALNVLEGSVFDLAILEFEMKVLAGVEFIKRLKSSKLLNPMKFIGLTSKTNPDLIKDGIANGVSDFLIKPLKVETILEKVTKVLQQNKESFVTDVELKIEAHFIQKFLISKITPSGMEVNTNFAFPEGDIVQIQSLVFKEIGIEVPILLVLQSKIIAPNKWRTKIEFQNLTSEAINKITKWKSLILSKKVS